MLTIDVKNINPLASTNLINYCPKGTPLNSKLAVQIITIITNNKL